MRLGIKGKQVLYVTSIVGVVVVVLSLLHVARLASVSLEESKSRAEVLAKAIFHRAREVVATSSDPYAALRTDPGLRAILESSIYGENVTDAAILDAHGTTIAARAARICAERPPPNACATRPVSKTSAAPARAGKNRIANSESPSSQRESAAMAGTSGG